MSIFSFFHHRNSYSILSCSGFMDRWISTTLHLVLEKKNVSIVNTATITSKISKQRVKKFACKGVAKLDALHT